MQPLRASGVAALAGDTEHDDVHVGDTQRAWPVCHHGIGLHHPLRLGPVLHGKQADRLALPKHTGRLLVGYCDHDNGWLWGCVSTALVTAPAGILW